MPQRTTNGGSLHGFASGMCSEFIPGHGRHRSSTLRQARHRLDQTAPGCRLVVRDKEPGGVLSTAIDRELNGVTKVLAVDDVDDGASSVQRKKSSGAELFDQRHEVGGVWAGDVRRAQDNRR